MKDVTGTVELDAIEAAVEQLWKRVAETEQQEKEYQLVRARVLNLVVLSIAQVDADVLPSTIDRVTESHPCRAILIVPASPSQHSHLQASVSVLCRPGLVSGEHVCCERVTISADPKAMERLPSAVTPLLVPDLPVFLWWRGSLRLPNVIFNALAEISDRLIIDSRDLTQIFLRLKIAEERGTELVVSDFAWARLTAWRQLTAQFFDGPVFRRQLDSIRKVIVGYLSSLSRIPPEALLYVGWLASRLQWHLFSDKTPRNRKAETSLTFSGPNGAIDVEFRPVESVRAGLAFVRLQTAAESSTFSISRTDDPEFIETRVHVPPAPPVERVVRISDHEVLHLLEQELRIVGHDTAYEQALAAASLIDQQLRR